MPEMDPVQQLLDIEAIKRLKARYFRYLDTKNWDAMRTLFTDDAHFDHSAGARDAAAAGFTDPVDPANVSDTGDVIVREIARRVGDAVTVHHGHMPEIEITGPTTARGIWPMFDYVLRAGRPYSIQGYGHYEDEYRKDGGVWKISSQRLTRLLIDRLGMPVPGRGPTRGWMDPPLARKGE